MGEKLAEKGGYYAPSGYNIILNKDMNNAISINGNTDHQLREQPLDTNSINEACAQIALFTVAPNIYGEGGLPLSDKDKQQLKDIEKQCPKAYEEAMRRYKEMRQEYMGIKEENQE